MVLQGDSRQTGTVNAGCKMRGKDPLQPYSYATSSLEYVNKELRYRISRV
jgi:hypothetical protein